MPIMEAKRTKMELGSSASASVAPVTPEQQNIERYESYLRKRGLSGAAAHYLTQYLMRLEGGNTGSAANTQVFKTRLVSVAAQLSEQVQLRRDLHVHRRLALQTPRRRQQAGGPLAAAGMSSGVVEWSRRGGVRSRWPRA